MRDMKMRFVPQSMLIIALLVFSAFLTTAPADDFSAFFHAPKKDKESGPKAQRITGFVRQKIGDDLYLFVIAQRVMDEYGTHLEYGKWCAIRGTIPADRSGDFVDFWVIPDGTYSYATNTGRNTTVDAYKIVPRPPPDDPEPSHNQEIFGQGTHMQGSALDEPPHR